MSAKIGVFPASGGLATSVITHLLKLVPPTQLVLIARYPEKLTDLSRTGATVRRGDYDDPETLNRVFDEVGILMLVSYASFEIDHRISVCCHVVFLIQTNGTTGPQISHRPSPPQWCETYILLLSRIWRRLGRKQRSTRYGCSFSNGEVSR